MILLFKAEVLESKQEKASGLPWAVGVQVWWAVLNTQQLPAVFSH